MKFGLIHIDIPYFLRISLIFELKILIKIQIITKIKFVKIGTVILKNFHGFHKFFHFNNYKKKIKNSLLINQLRNSFF